MIGLSFDTCFKSTSVSLFVNGDIQTIKEERAFRQSDTLAKITEEMLVKNNISMQDIDFFLATKGPGSFTGIRIALSFIEGATFTLNAKKYYLTAFASILGELSSIMEENILVIINAIRETFYVQLFDKNLKPLNSPQYLSLEELQTIIMQEKCKLFGSFEGFEFKNIQGRLISNSATVNSANNFSAFTKYKWLIDENKTPFYFREALGGGLK